MSDDFENDGNSADAKSETIDLGGIAERIEQQREKSRSFLANQKDRLDSIETRLTNDVEAIAAKLTAWTDYESKVTDWCGTVEKKDAELEKRRKDFEETRQQEEESLRSERTALEAGETEQLKQLHAEIEGLQVQLADETKAVAEACRERDKYLANAGVENEELSAQLEGELQSTRDALSESRNEKSAIEQELSRTANELQQRGEEISGLREEICELSRDNSGSTSDRLLVEAREERDNLLEEVARLRSQQGKQSADQPALAKLHRKFELAVRKVRELKAHNMKLEGRLSTLESATESSECISDWETHKKRTLAELEEGDTAANTEATRSDNSTGVTSDDLVNEREKLKNLQDEWQKKLSSAEVEISIERAQNARMRTELLEKMRDLEEQLDRAHKNAGEPTDAEGKSRGRWLDRLGLGEND